MKPDVYLTASLATHRRGDVLMDIFPQQSLADTSELPVSGTLMMLGQDWQGFSTEQRDNYWTWLKEAGRQVLLIPPFIEGPVDRVLDWQVKRVQGELKSDIGLANYLADEVKFEFEAVSRQFVRELGHCWSDDSINTLYYKAHASGGMLSATSLPLWSLSCLDEIELVNTWFDGLYQIAGKARSSDLNQENSSLETPFQIELKDEHFALLCCSYGQSLADYHVLISRVNRLGVFSIDAAALELAAEDLIKSGLLLGGEITDGGKTQLMVSPYKIYAEELMRMPG